MDAASRELLSRIERFPLDRPTSAFLFSERLARDEGWPLAFTHRAIREYRRFVYLAVSAGHPVSPSAAVDKVWHQHLTYTRSYWDEFCGKVLGEPLHHEPTHGGQAEGEKFADWYQRTLGSYRRVFDEEPPADLWPPAPARFAVKRRSGRFCGTELRKRWPMLAALALCLMVAGCTSVLAAGLGPFDFTGRDFLPFFWTIAVLTLIAGARIRAHFSQSPRGSLEAAPPENPYAIALLNGGTSLAVHAAVARLVQDGFLQANVKRQTLTPARVPDGTLSELEQRIAERVTGLEQAKLADLTGFAAPALFGMEEELRNAGLLVSVENAARARKWPLLLSLGVLLIGLTKIAIGISRDRPVAFLVISCVVFALVAGLMFGRRVWRSREGSGLLRKMRSRYQPDMRRGRAPEGQGNSYGLPAAVGLFGYAALQNTEAASLRRMFQPNGGDGSGILPASGCSGSDSSGGDSGGSSGCGGCGGGGGD